MKIVISENQNKILLQESITEGIVRNYKTMKKFAHKVLSETKETTGLDFGFLLSWGATLGGFMMPVTKFIEGEYPELTSVDLSLIATGAIVTYYTSNTKYLSKILEEIKERGLEKIFDKFLSKTSELRNVFINFIESLNITFSKIANMLAYTFLIPILPQLYEMAQMGYDGDTINQIIKRLISYGVIIGSSVIVKEIIRKILSRFKN